MPDSIRNKRIAWQGFLLLNLAIILFYWWNGSATLFSAQAGLAGILTAFGKLAGLAAAYAVLLQFFFMGRMPWLERVFGLDKLSRLHHTNGKLALLFIVAHPILLTVGYARAANVGLWNQFVLFITQYEHVVWALVGTILFLVVVGSSVYIVRSKLRYEAWYFVHLLVYLAIFSSFWHQIEVGSDFVVSRVFYSYWVALYTAVFASHLVFRFARPLYRFSQHQFEVAKIVRETASTVSVYIKGKNLAAFPVRPGQFMIFRFLSQGMWWQAHPFSLSRPTDGEFIRITVKQLGDFTKRVDRIPTGTKVIIDGPYGVFTDFFCISKSVLLIAGGIGITPVRSLIEQLSLQGKQIVLLYANRTRNDIVFKKELDALAHEKGIQIQHILSDEPAAKVNMHQHQRALAHVNAETGRVDREKIERLVPDVVKRDVFLCGPPPMMDALIATLRDLGGPQPQIHFERFSL